MRRHRARHADRRAGRRGSASGSAASASAPPTPTASPTSTSVPCSTSTAATAALATMTVVRPAPAVGRGRARRGRPRRRLRREAAQRALDQRRLLLLRARARSTTSTRTACSSASRWSALAADGELRAFRHEGFWDCMDTYKDAVVLNDLWAGGEAPWRVWDARRGGGAVKRALVTGGHGFVASHLARALLERGDAVTVLDLAAAAALGPGPAGDRARGRAGRGRPARRRSGSAPRSPAGEFDVVFHLAAQTLVGPAMADPAATFEANVRGTWNLLEACRARRGPGASSSPPPTRPTGPARSCPTARTCSCAPASPYEASKAAADAIALSYRPAYGLPVAVTRFANIYGGGDLNFSRLIPEAVAAVLDGRRPAIRSDGSPERDFLYVDDAVAAYLAIERAVGAGGPAAGEAFNAGGERPHSVARCVEPIAAVSRRRPRARIPRRRQPGRRDRPPVRRLGQAARADRLEPRGRAARRPGPHPRVVPRPPGGPTAAG